MSSVGRWVALASLAAVVLGCAGSPAATSGASSATSAAAAASAPSVGGSSVRASVASSVAASPATSQSFKAGSWPPEWQLWICSARAQMLREDAKKGGTPGEDAATQAIADLKNTTINWESGADFRALLGKAAAILLDAARRPGNAMDDVPPAIKTSEVAYADLKASTGFECPA